MLPVWLWGYVLLAGALASGLQIRPDRRDRTRRRRPAHLLAGRRPRVAAAAREHTRVELIAAIESELKEARLARDADRRDALTLIRASLRAAETELKRPLSEDEELQVLQRKHKKRVQAFQAFEAIGRLKQADKEAYQLVVLEEFMPGRLLPAARLERGVAFRTAGLSR
jgi:uncharacterized protein YqeY